jgi:alpha-galactosidase
MLTIHNINAFKHVLLAIVGCLFFTLLFAQQKTTIPIITSKNAMVLQTDINNRLNTIYFGKRLANAGEFEGIAKQYNFKDDNRTYYNNAYTAAGSYSLVEPAIQAIHGDGNTSLDLKYISHDAKQLDDNTSLTTIALRIQYILPK